MVVEPEPLVDYESHADHNRKLNSTKAAGDRTAALIRAKRAQWHTQHLKKLRDARLAEEELREQELIKASRLFAPDAEIAEVQQIAAKKRTNLLKLGQG